MIWIRLLPVRLSVHFELQLCRLRFPGLPLHSRGFGRSRKGCRQVCGFVLGESGL